MTIKNVTVTIDPASVVADGVTAAVATAVVIDDADAAVVGIAVTWSADDVAVKFADAAAVTDADGKATVNVTSSTANPTVTVTATAETVTGTVSVAFTAAASDNTISSLTVKPMDALPGTDEVFSALVVDADGVPVVGATVTWNCEDSAALSATTSDTDSKGVATVTVNSAYAGVLAVTANVGSSYAVATANYARSSLKPVFIPNGMDGELDIYDLKNDVQVVINSYDQASAGDTLIFHWDNVHRSTKAITNPAVDFPITFDITNDFPPACLASGTYSVFYQYTDQAGNINVSLPVNLTISGGNLPATLAAPTFSEGKDGWINLKEANTDGGTPVQITYEGMTEGDSLHVTWQGYDESGIAIPDTYYEVDYAVTADDADAQLCAVVVPTDSIMPIVKGTAQADYLLTPVSGGDKQQSVAAEVGVDVQP